MARKKTDKASGKADGDNAAEGVRTGLDAVIVHGIWGLVYLTLGALLFISMIFYSPAQIAGGDAHVLGPYLGTGLAEGMFYLFGRFAAFLFPVAVCYIGAAKLRSRPLQLKLLLFLTALTLELCVLLSISRMADLAVFGLSKTADTNLNFLGLLIVSGFLPIFGSETLGPYLIVSLLMAITLVACLRIRPQIIFSFLLKIFRGIVRWLKKIFTAVKTGIKESPDIVSPFDNIDIDVKNDAAGDGDADDKNAGRSRSSKKKIAKSVADVDVPDDNDIVNSSDDVDSDNDTDNISDTGISGDSGNAGGAGNGNDAGDIESEGDTDDTIINDNTAGNDSVSDLSPEEELELFLKTRGADILAQAVETPDVEVADDDGIAPFEMADRETAVFMRDDGRESGGEQSNNIGDDDTDAEFIVVDPPPPVKPYVLPSPDILSDPPPLSSMSDQTAIARNIMTLEKTLSHFKIKGQVRSYSSGPVVTRYEIVLEPGVKVSRVTSLQDDLLMAVGAEAIRIQAPIPGKSAVGIELPNDKRQNVHFKHILTSDEFKKSFALPVIIGSNISGVPYVTDIVKTPHLLVAGQTGSGKSVCMNSLICTMLMTKKPDELRLIMVDPKQVEFASYENIPHLLAPIVTEAKEAVKALQWSVMEMERRYKLLTSAGVRKIDDFNAKVESGKLAGVLSEEDNKHMPLIVIIIDELADLMMTAPKDVEQLIARITQKARAAGMHMIIATQRPSVNVITGLIKANLPSRIAFRTVSSIDSRTILDQGGSEKLLGMGDMLFLRNGAQNVERFHGAFIPDEDVDKIVAAIKEQEAVVDTIGSFNDVIDDPDDGGGSGGGESDGGGKKRDDLFAEAARTVVSLGIGSTSLLQRQMEIGFARAGRIMDQLERAGIVGPPKGSKPREVLVRPDELEGFL